MHLYRFKIKPKEPFTHVWQADTLFGGLCWALRDIEGEAVLTQLLATQDSAAPALIISNGFPGDLLPRPILPLPSIERSRRDEYYTALTNRKTERKIKWLRLGEFNLILSGKSFTDAVSVELDSPWRSRAWMSLARYHNTINRSTETVLPDNGLYAEQEYVLNDEISDYVSVYAMISEEWKELIIRTFMVLGHVGLGGEKTTGRGGFEVLEIQPFTGFSVPQSPGGFVTLSDFVPCADDPVAGFWSIRAKLGRVGGYMANSGNPFKKPLIALEAGSCFQTANPRLFYGRMVKNIAPAHPEVMQYGLALPVAMDKSCFESHKGDVNREI